jgi:hypothetical protein
VARIVDVIPEDNREKTSCWRCGCPELHAIDRQHKLYRCTLCGSLNREVSGVGWWGKQKRLTRGSWGRSTERT